MCGVMPEQYYRIDKNQYRNSPSSLMALPAAGRMSLLSYLVHYLVCVAMTKVVNAVCPLQQRLSRGVKSSLLLFTLAQTAISTILCFLLFRQRRSFGQYTVRLHHFL